jgi:hypothetical protein
MIGWRAIDTEAGVQEALSIGERARRGSRFGEEDVPAILEGEVDLAVLRCGQVDPRNRAAIERNLAKAGARLDAQFIVQMLFATQYPLLGLDLAGVFNGALEGEIELAFAVGTIRTAGEQCAAEMAKIH